MRIHKNKACCKIISLFILLWLITSCSSITTNNAYKKLAVDINTILASPELAGGQAAIMVRDAESGTIIYQHNADQRLIPASSMKLLTAAAAFEILGPQYQFRTSVATDGVQKNHILIGNLYLRGTGDPSIRLEDYQMLVAEIAKRGIKYIQGNIVIDDTWFDNIRLGKDWAQDDEDQSYAAQISALTLSPPDSDYDAGSVVIKLVAGKENGQPVVASIIPETRYITLINDAVTGDKDALTIKREHGNNKIMINGSLSIGQVRSVTRSVWEPTQMMAHVFESLLRQQGIQVHGKTLIGLPTPENVEELAVHTSISLSELSIPFLKFSKNIHAEILLKAIGRKVFNSGTSEAGIKAVTEFMQRHEIDPTVMLQIDGSGLSRRNLITPKILTEILMIACRQSWFDTWYLALPIAGISDRLIGGTLSNRMRDTIASGNVVAKTGTLGAVSSLSGYVTTLDRQKLVFSIMLNNALTSVKKIEDKIAVVLANLRGALFKSKKPQN